MRREFINFHHDAGDQLAVAVGCSGVPLSCSFLGVAPVNGNKEQRGESRIKKYERNVEWLSENIKWLVQGNIVRTQTKNKGKNETTRVEIKVCIKETSNDSQRVLINSLNCDSLLEPVVLDSRVSISLGCNYQPCVSRHSHANVINYGLIIGDRARATPILLPDSL